MLTTSTRPYTAVELDLYSEMMDDRISLILGFIISAVLGAAIAAGTYGIHWFYAWMTSGTPSWTVPLIVGAAVAVIAFFALRGGSGDDWTQNPPKLATEVVATSDAAWIVDDDTLGYRFVLRVEPDRFIVVNQGVESAEREGFGVTSERIGSEIKLVLLGEGQLRRVIDSQVSGPQLELRNVEIPPEDEWTSAPEGIYELAQLPKSVREIVTAS